MSFKYKLGDFISTKAGIEGFVCGRFWKADTSDYSYHIKTETASVECQEKDCCLVKHKPVEFK